MKIFLNKVFLYVFRLYNGNLKEEFLHNAIELQTTRATAFYEFLQSARLERRLNKDLYAFNDVEIAELLKAMGRSNVGSISKALSIYNSYVKWAIKNGKRGEYENGINNVQAFVRTESSLQKYVSNKKLYNKILDRDEFEYLVNLMVNPIDKALLLCFYNFVVGEQMYEIRSLKREDIDIENQTLTVRTRPDAEPRKQKVSKELIKQLLLTDKSKEYYRNDGEDWAVGTGSTPAQEFIDSEYIFKPTRRGASDYSMFSLSGLNSKIKNIRKFADFPYITPTSIRDTRIVHEVIKVMKQQGITIPNDETYELVQSHLKEEYNYVLTRMKTYSIKQKVEQLLKIKEF